MVHRSFGLEDKKAVATKLAEKFQVATVEDFVNNKMVRISEDYYLYSSDEISKEFNKTIF
jgi:transposase